MANGSLSVNTSWGTISLNDQTVNKVFDKAFGWVGNYADVDLASGNTPATTNPPPPPALGSFNIGGMSFSKNQLLTAGIGVGVLGFVILLTRSPRGNGNGGAPRRRRR